jgi:hypothetical protein
MDLSLNLGIPDETLARSMTESDFRRWQAYAAKRMLPTRRLEVYMAQIAYLIARTMGNSSDAKLTDFLFDAPKAEDPEQDLRDMFGFAPKPKREVD